MFKCHAGHISKPGEREYKVTLETRKRDYFNPKTGKLEGTGYETVKEVSSCEEHIPSEK